MSSDSIPIKVKGKVVGTLENGVYTTPRNSWNHYYRKGRGYPISVSVLDILLRCGCRTIRIEETQVDRTIHVYECPLELYLKGQILHYPPYDNQRNVKLRRMKHLQSDDGAESYQTRLA